MLLADKFGDTLLDPTKMQEKEKEVIRMLKRNSAINKEVMVEYRKLVK
ncbi:MAG: hypothetical protein ACRCVU_04660 [Flavobacterium sp.]